LTVKAGAGSWPVAGSSLLMEELRQLRIQQRLKVTAARYTTLLLFVV
jgi:hypothetical protein